MPHLAEIIIFVIVFGAVLILRRGNGSDADWKARWNALPIEERRRLARAARSGTLLASQEEIELAAGYARRERRGGFPLRVVAALNILVALIFVLIGLLVPGAGLLALLGSLLLLIVVFREWRSRRVGGALRETIDRDRGY